MSDTPETPARSHRWRFFRAGGFDQVRLESAADLRALGELDQKLWVALACPGEGLEFDPRTLALIDSDGDGRVRAPELLAAVRWATARLKETEGLLQGGGALPLASIDDSDEEGAGLLASARQVLANLGRADAHEIAVDDVADTARVFAATLFNGDGVVPAAAAGDDAATAAAIEAIVGSLGGVPDRSGATGVDAALVERFFGDAAALLAWTDAGAADPDTQPLGGDSTAAVALFDALDAKVTDYFTRCRLAAFDQRAAPSLNAAAEEFAALAPQLLSAGDAAIAALPLAQVGAGHALPLGDGVNPAWAAQVAQLGATLVTPLLGARDSVDAEGWETLRAQLAPCRDWLAGKPATAVEALGPERLRELADGPARASIEALLARDRELEPQANALAAVERLVRYHRDLATLLHNFVNFRDFYARKTKAIFQAGTLYLDGRACELVLRVNDPGKHAGLAGLSGIYLAYCDATRRGSGEKMAIVAAFTGGDAEQLRVGRNGVFYDRQGRDWDATITKVVENPISIRQAFWTPYKRIARMIGEQVEKLASAREKAVQDQAGAGIGAVAKGAEAGKAPPAPFDIGKFVGIFAAIGLALGAIGSALAAVVTGLLGLAWWQIPLALAGAVLAVSGPSMLIAWLKLRQRNLGPLLDANGWAVNARARINLPFGAALTAVAALPKGAERSLSDPYAEEGGGGGWLVVLLVAAAAAAWWWWGRGG